MTLLQSYSRAEEEQIFSSSIRGDMMFLGLKKNQQVNMRFLLLSWGTFFTRH